MALRLWQQTRPLQATARQCSDAAPPDPQNTANRTGASSPVTIAVLPNDETKPIAPSSSP